MKFLLFFVLIGLFVWVAIVPPEGMSKYPAINVEFEYSQANGEAQISVGKASAPQVDLEEEQE